MDNGAYAIKDLCFTISILTSATKQFRSAVDKNKAITSSTFWKENNSKLISSSTYAHVAAHLLTCDVYLITEQHKLLTLN